MFVKNLQSVALCVAKLGVRVTGTDCTGSMTREPQVPILSLPWQTLSGRFPTGPDAKLADENAAMARAIHRAGRSAAFAGVIARGSKLVLSTRSLRPRSY
jgi:hypothetical protein